MFPRYLWYKKCFVLFGACLLISGSFSPSRWVSWCTRCTASSTGRSCGIKTSRAIFFHSDFNLISLVECYEFLVRFLRFFPINELYEGVDNPSPTIVTWSFVYCLFVFWVWWPDHPFLLLYYSCVWSSTTRTTIRTQWWVSHQSHTYYFVTYLLTYFVTWLVS